MKNNVLNKIRTPVIFLLSYSAILNAVFADNRYFSMFAVCSSVFSALLLVCCVKYDTDTGYKRLFSVFVCGNTDICIVKECFRRQSKLIAGFYLIRIRHKQKIIHFIR